MDVTEEVLKAAGRFEGGEVDVAKAVPLIGARFIDPAKLLRHGVLCLFFAGGIRIDLTASPEEIAAARCSVGTIRLGFLGKTDDSWPLNDQRELPQRIGAHTPFIRDTENPHSDGLAPVKVLLLLSDF